MKIAAFGLKPVIIMQNIISMVAIEFREAKKPFVVEKRPIKAKARIGRLINGDRNTLSIVLCQEKTGAKPLKMFGKKLSILKLAENSSPIIVFGC